MDKLNILTFVEEYKSANDKEKVLKKIKVKGYIPFAMKKSAIEVVLDELLVINNGFYSCDPMMEHLLFSLSVVSIYTNLIYEEEEGIASYDALVESGLLDEIIQRIGYDYTDYVHFFEETLRNRINENNSLASIVNEFLTGILGSIESFDAEKIKESFLTEVKKLR